jgi:molybdate transport system substrate-binding protein
MEAAIRRIWLSLALIIAYQLTACTTAASSGKGSGETPVTQAEQSTRISPGKTLSVYAAASLTDAFKELGLLFEGTHPGVEVNFGFAGSQVLRTQLEQGAPADVFASADQENMDMLVAADLVEQGSAQVFATNRLVVILPSHNTAGVHTLADLAKPGMKVVLVDPSVPAGRYALQLLDNLRQDKSLGMEFASSVLKNVVSHEIDVRQVVTKVELGEADVGIVYFSDSAASPNLLTLPVPDEFNITARYPIAILTNSPNSDLATAFISTVNSTAGREIMRRWGFNPGQ